MVFGTFVVDTSSSPHAKLRPVPIEAVRLKDRFWAPRLRLLQARTLPTQYKICEETGRVSNFRWAAGKEAGGFRGYFFNDSDVYKWVEAVAFSIAGMRDEGLLGLVESVVDDIVGAQDEDGYLDTYFAFERKGERWTNLRDMHELYCAGHFIQAAIALYRATGRRKALDAALRLADHLVDVFGPGKRAGTPGHPEVEMALVELYRLAGKGEYLELAKSFLDNRGKGIVGGSRNLIDHEPFRQLKEAVGHAVRSLYLDCGAADIYMETGEKELLSALENIWRNFTGRRMYVTGGAGARHDGEAFGVDYELPNVAAYAETCAAVASAMWNWRMFLMTGEGRFFDVLELALYNGALSGISLDGEEYFYVNPLADRGGHRRQRWFDCACCPPNIARLIASVPGYCYSLSEEGVWVNVYAESVARIELGGKPLTLEQRTEYPWDGKVELELDPGEERRFAIFLRIPGWCRGASAKVDGRPAGEEAKPGSYLGLQRTWKAGDRVELDLPMEVEMLESDPNVAENAGRVALKRGPIVYCFEQADNPGFDIWDLVLTAGSKVEAVWQGSLLNGVAVLKGEGLAFDSDWSGGRLYFPKARREPRRVEFKAVPYYAWANRQSGPMSVWVRCQGA
ncbi:MAG: glycoside hydrolase family 127 protein [Candidatus Brockarchaeota archaeon]|nr:glycoside hydrolase family 127 protein [Candidatus Brockarchaeota archaeon]